MSAAGDIISDRAHRFFWRTESTQIISNARAPNKLIVSKSTVQYFVAGGGSRGPIEPIRPMATSRLRTGWVDVAGGSRVGQGEGRPGEQGGSCWGRDRSSCVEMQDDAGAQQPVAASEKALAETVSEKIQALKVQPRVQQVLQSSACTRFNTWWSVEKHRVALSRCLISTYFLNVWVSSLQMWWIGRAGFPFLTLGLVVPAVLLVANRWMHITGWVLLAEIAKDCTSLLWGVFLIWMYRGNFYLNELMVKKLSMLGVTLLVIYQHYSSDSSKKNPLAGLIGPDSTKTPSSKESVALLVSRLLLTSLFIWAGQAEIRRQLASVHDDGQGHQVHERGGTKTHKTTQHHQQADQWRSCENTD